MSVASHGALRSPMVRVAGFACVLVLSFAAAWGIGRVTAVPHVDVAVPAAQHDMSGMAGMDDMAGMDMAAPVDEPQGLLAAKDGYRVDLADRRLAVGAPTTLTFRIVGPDGAPVTSFTRHQDQLMHFIVVRRDLSGFQHLHPTMAADGTWTQELTVAEGGSYRAFLQFVTETREFTLGVDLDAAGDYRPRTVPAAAPTADVDGFHLARSDAEGTVAFHVERDGAPVTTLEPYLGSVGHLTALRVGDLAFVHIHPRPGGSGPDIAFATGNPPPGTYRMFLQFQVAGVVHTAAFTAELG